MRTNNLWSCDFETTTDPNDCRVWAWVAINIYDNKKRVYGNSISTFIDFLWGHNRKCYFHNLKFDGTFILDYLLKNGWTLNKEKKQLQTCEFNTLISDKGFYYTMCLCFGPKSKCEIIDSLKILPYSVDAIAKGWKLPVQKLHIDYKEYREPGHELTKEEKDYITNDALIVAIALKSTFDDGYKKITAGSNAFNFYVDKCMGGKKGFRKTFPVPENDAYLRKAYRGGFTYVAPQYKNKLVGAGRVYDVNSLYPFALHSPHVYPYGEPIYFTGEYQKNDKYPLYFQRFYCDFKLKPEHLPTIQMKNTAGYIPTEYVTESLNDSVPLTLTSVDLALFFDQYDVYNYRPIDGYMYKAGEKLFDTYIDYFYKQKQQAKQEKNYARYQLAKLMLNSFYGKMATNPICASRWPTLKDNRLAYLPGEIESREPVYIPVGCFCTAYARDVTIRAAQSCFDRFMYADTDSLHVLGDYDVPGLDVDDYRLGAFKHENTFTQAKYLRPKLYMEEMITGRGDSFILNDWTVTGAGMTKSVKQQVTIESFEYGAMFDGKLTTKVVPGGTVLVDTTFKIHG